MKKISQKEAEIIFNSFGCLLTGDYESCSKPVSYKCKCGRFSQISIDKLKRRAKRKEGCRFCNCHEWTKEEDEVLKKMYGIEPRAEIEKHLIGITQIMIKARAKYLGLKGNTSQVNKKARKGKGKKYQFYQEFFSKKSNVSCYWAGFIAGGGYVLPSKNTISINLPAKDKHHLEKLQDDACHTGIIHSIKNHKQFLLHFHSAEKWIKDLKEYFNITERKLNTLQPPKKLREVHSLSFIVGYIDSCGLFSKNTKNLDYYLQIHGTESFLTWIKTFFDRLYPPLGKKIANVNKVKNFSYKYAVQGVRAKYLIKKLLSIQLPRLERKWIQYFCL